ncbi:MAG TPA: helix-turn-helix domain-containing protein [Candidatus Saccharimonadales bacterium]|nr:helix-turn-helix domain-containing protein [Candidatus Saccharimonadales bacterium]
MHEYFRKLGFSSELADIYLTLQAYGPQNLLQLSRNAGVERIRLYRLIDELKACNLVEIETHYKRHLYKPAPFTNLQIVISKREQENRDLEAEMNQLYGQLEQTSLRSPLTHVQFYHGADGVKQMLWNETKATTENLVILYENMQNKTNLVFFERWAARCNERDLKFRGVVCDHYLNTQAAWYAEHNNGRLQNWAARRIAPELLTIRHSTITYDDVVAYYNWKDDDVFGVELHNKEIAGAQRQMFEILWGLATPAVDTYDK